MSQVTGVGIDGRSRILVSFMFPVVFARFDCGWTFAPPLGLSFFCIDGSSRWANVVVLPVSPWIRNMQRRRAYRWMANLDRYGLVVRLNRVLPL